MLRSVTRGPAEIVNEIGVPGNYDGDGKTTS